MIQFELFYICLLMYLLSYKKYPGSPKLTFVMIKNGGTARDPRGHGHSWIWISHMTLLETQRGFGFWVFAMWGVWTCRFNVILSKHGQPCVAEVALCWQGLWLREVPAGSLLLILLLSLSLGELWHRKKFSFQTKWVTESLIRVSLLCLTTTGAVKNRRCALLHFEIYSPSVLPLLHLHLQGPLQLK